MQPQTQTEGIKLTVAEAAKHFNRCQVTIRRWCADGTLLAFNYAVIRERPGCWTIIIPQ